ncbi:YaiI/YqxD family protein [Ferroacidibacillus organovorans]|uniref:Uncharacterized protein n=1 Tax=Ferroacidibacillus organovorans TaxID=1765683 RepID=A0A162TWZ6_9BACL|nr:DUF188 domain-containing protein [Ferroacidibacillus organovorans]KYP81202.1 hypothetical protein AYJ22_08185 [Ferroacidibacillus organovorans]OAG93901.1 hypothetical protein AYW79_08155 [Ferroacidibacillus organovorans]OPG17713.1 hypothetical protein B2M26_00780 [Ferroacidibacillus organovorans]
MTTEWNDSAPHALPPAPRVLYLDADACPRTARQIANEVCAKKGLRVVTVSSYDHHMEGADHLQVAPGPDATDYAILARMKQGDLVVTEDYGLAALVLARRGKALSSKGFVYTAQNIDPLLEVRALGQKLRRAKAKHRLKGPSARTKQDDEQFREALLTQLSD